MLSRYAAGIAAAIALSGCSYLTMDRPPKAVRRSDVVPACTTENTRAYVDVALATFMAVGAGMIYAGRARVDDEDAPMMKRELTDGERVYMGTFALLEGGLFVLSARYGFESAKSCRELQSQLASQPPAQPYQALAQPDPPQQPAPGGAP